MSCSPSKPHSCVSYPRVLHAMATGSSFKTSGLCPGTSCLWLFSGVKGAIESAQILCLRFGSSLPLACQHSLTFLQSWFFGILELRSWNHDIWLMTTCLSVAYCRVVLMCIWFVTRVLASRYLYLDVFRCCSMKSSIPIGSKRGSQLMINRLSIQRLFSRVPAPHIALSWFALSW